MSENEDFCVEEMMKGESNFPRERGLMERIDTRPSLWMKALPLDSKIIFLNKENLTEFEGYKAEVDLIDGILSHYEIRIVLTGFSSTAAYALFDKLKAMKKEEIYSNKSSP